MRICIEHNTALVGDRVPRSVRELRRILRECLRTWISDSAKFYPAGHESPFPVDVTSPK